MVKKSPKKFEGLEKAKTGWRLKENVGRLSRKGWGKIGRNGWGVLRKCGGKNVSRGVKLGENRVGRGEMTGRGW